MSLAVRARGRRSVQPRPYRSSSPTPIMCTVAGHPPAREIHGRDLRRNRRSLADGGRGLADPVHADARDALQGQVRRAALDELERAYAAGWRDGARRDFDLLLRSLRPLEPLFTQLLTRIQSDVAAMRARDGLLRVAVGPKPAVHVAPDGGYGGGPEMVQLRSEARRLVRSGENLGHHLQVVDSNGLKSRTGEFEVGHAYVVLLLKCVRRGSGLLNCCINAVARRASSDVHHVVLTVADETTSTTVGAANRAERPAMSSLIAASPVHVGDRRDSAESSRTGLQRGQSRHRGGLRGRSREPSHIATPGIGESRRGRPDHALDSGSMASRGRAAEFVIAFARKFKTPGRFRAGWPRRRRHTNAVAGRTRLQPPLFSCSRAPSWQPACRARQEEDAMFRRTCAVEWR